MPDEMNALQQAKLLIDDAECSEGFMKHSDEINSLIDGAMEAYEMGARMLGIRDGKHPCPQCDEMLQIEVQVNAVCRVHGAPCAIEVPNDADCRFVLDDDHNG